MLSKGYLCSIIEQLNLLCGETACSGGVSEPAVQIFCNINGQGVPFYDQYIRKRNINS